MTKNIAIVFLISIFSFEAFACSSIPRTDEEKFNDAERVFRAKIVATKLSKENHEGESFEIVKATYRLIESYKGKNPKKGIVKEIPFGPGNCMLGLMTGVEYVIYLDGNTYVTLPSGSWGYFNSEGTEVLSKLKKLRALSK